MKGGRGKYNVVRGVAAAYASSAVRPSLGPGLPASCQSLAKAGASTSPWLDRIPVPDLALCHPHCATG